VDTLRAQLLGRIGAYSKWAKTVDRTAATEPLRRGLQAKYEREVLETAMAAGAVLTPRQVAERAESLRLAHLARARLAAHDARVKRKRVTSEKRPVTSNAEAGHR
jgi:hypothetical protein